MHRFQAQDWDRPKSIKLVNKTKQETVYLSENYKTEVTRERVDQSSSYIMEWTQKYSIDNLISPQYKWNRTWFSPEQRDNNKINQQPMTASASKMQLKSTKSNAELALKGTKSSRKKINHTTVDFRFAPNEQIFNVKVCNSKQINKQKDSSRVRNRRLKDYESGEEIEVNLCSSQTQYEKRAPSLISRKQSNNDTKSKRNLSKNKSINMYTSGGFKLSGQTSINLWRELSDEEIKNMERK